MELKYFQKIICVINVNPSKDLKVTPSLSYKEI